MKNSARSKFFPASFLLLGIVAAALYRWMYTAAVDAAGLLKPWSVQEIVLLVLTAVACIGSFADAKYCKAAGTGKLLPAIGNLIFAVGVYTLTTIPAKGPTAMVTLYRIFSYVSVPALAVSAGMQLTGKKPFFLLDVCPCVLAALHLVECYQLWSEVPQLMDYFFGVGALLGIILFAFYRIARSVDQPFLPRHLAYCFMGIYFCCVAVMMNAYSVFFATAAIWMVTDLTAALSGAPQEA